MAALEPQLDPQREPQLEEYQGLPELVRTTSQHSRKHRPSTKGVEIRESKNENITDASGTDEVTIGSRQSDDPITSSQSSSSMSKIKSVASLRRTDSVKQRVGPVTNWYTLESEPVAAGAFGRVFRGKTKGTKEHRAIKSIPFGNIGSQQEEDDFKKEVEIHKMLKHPNIIRLHDTVIDDTAQEWYLVMDLCFGGDLFQKLQFNGRKPNTFREHTLARYAYEMLNGIKYCHFHKFIHRDIKPENYMLLYDDDRSPLKLIDFGIGCIFTLGSDARTVPMTEMIGTVQQVAPEVMQESYTEKADIWSIGVTMYVLAVAMPPFFHSNENSLKIKIRDGPSIDDTIKQQKVFWKAVMKDKAEGDLSVQHIIREMLVVDPELRPSADQLLKSSKWLEKRDEALAEPPKRCCTLQ